MNRNIINTLLAGAATVALASCGENTWNDHFLNGFEGGVNYDKAVTGSYSLTTDDYKAISDLMVAKATTDEEKAQAKAIATNCYFDKNSAFPASVALPSFMQTASFPYYLASNGSQADVAYAEADAVPGELAAISGAEEYTLSSNDYKNAWGSDEDYINAFAPMTSAANKLPGILKNAFPDASEGAYAIVRYNESETNPIFISNSDAEEFIGGAFYIVADGTKCASALAASYTYGYLPTVDVTVTDGSVNTDAANAFYFVAADGGYYLKDVYGRYLYQSGTYNSFNVSATAPESGAVWTVDVASNGRATVTNVATGKFLQYDASHNNWAAYAEESGSLPLLFKAPAPKFYLVTEDGHGAAPIASDKKYGYLVSEAMTVTDGIVDTDPANAFTFETVKGGYNIKDSYGRYLYQSGTYNSFNLSEEMPESGALWTVAYDENGFATITNTEVGKWIQYDTKYDSWGSYDSQSGLLPKMYNAALKAQAPANRPAKVVAGTPVTQGINAVYYFDGNAWSVADGVSALNPADYTAMGVDNDKLTSPEVYIPLYLKNKLQYAIAGDRQIVVYNYNKADLFVFDGADWTLNNNGLENVVGRYTKSDNTWSFTKYIGKATFNVFKEDQIMLDRSYLLVYGSICATPLDKSSNYGYLAVASVEVKDGTIVLPSDANAFTFASKATVDGTEYSAPDGMFFLVDSNGRYYYYDGSHASSQVSDKPTITDGNVAPGFCWSAKNDGDGNWIFESDYGDGNVRWLVYSSSYNNFAIYSTITENDHYPALYLMD